MSGRWGRDRRRDEPYDRPNGGRYENGGNHRSNHPGGWRGGWNHERRPYEARYNQDQNYRNPPSRPQQQNGHVGGSRNATRPGAESDRKRPVDTVSSTMNIDSTIENDWVEVSLPKKPFMELNYKQQLIEQIPDTEKDKEAFKGRLPAESLRPRTGTGMKPRSHQWKKRKEETASKLVEEMKASWPSVSSAPMYDYDSDDMLEDIQNDSMAAPVNANGPRDPVLYQLLEKFILALPTCHLLTIGFDYSGTSDEETCFCPCHHQQTKQWRNVASITIEGGERGDKCGECTNKGRFGTPNALVMHLRTMQSCEFHKYTLLYLEELYGDWHLSHGLKHKGLLLVGMPEYKTASALEQKQPDRVLLTEMTKRDETQQQLEETIEELAKLQVNAIMAETLKQKLKEHEELLKKVGIDPANPSSCWIPPSADQMFPKDKAKFDRFLDRIQLRFGLEGTKSDRTLHVEQGFSLQERFDSWADPNSTEFGSILFRELQGANDVHRLLSSWRIQYGVHEGLEYVSKKEKREVSAIDEGGPEKQFLSEVWQMLPNLEVSVSGSPQRLKLFEPTSNGYPSYIPVGDSRLRGSFSTDDEYREAKKKVGTFYRAIGRLFAYCICRGHSIPNQVLPKLFCNAILRDCKPGDLDYHPRDLATHLFELDWNQKTLSEAQKMYSPEEFRTDIIEGICISERKTWFQNFRDGVTCKTVTGEECVPFSDCFSSMPLDNVERLIFATHQFSADDLFRVMVPHYSDDEIVRETQEAVFNVGLKRLLEKWASHDRKRLHWFCEFCTGATYLNTDPQSNFKIDVHFGGEADGSDVASEQRLPECHTCDMSISFPRTAYNGNYETLEAKLNKALDCCHNTYTMN